MITEAAGVALVVVLGVGQARAHTAAREQASRAVQAARAAAGSAARTDARAGAWGRVYRGGWLPRIAAAPDPGNPGHALVLCHDPHGLAGRRGGRVLLAVNGSPGPDGAHTVHALPVPNHIGDPVAAAAWTYDDSDHPVRCTPATYAALTRRT